VKQRPLTQAQLKLIQMEREGYGDDAIAQSLGVHVGTVRLKRAAIRRGLAKNAYSNYPEDTRQAGLFDMADLS
jgi:DNA-binding NarL/FixJ family response regulator